MTVLILESQNRNIVVVSHIEELELSVLVYYEGCAIGIERSGAVLSASEVFLDGVAILLFAGSSYEWLSQKKGLQLSRWAYYPMVLLAGAMSFTFATPTISYDSLELILAMSAASFLFVLSGI